MEAEGRRDDQTPEKPEDRGRPGAEELSDRAAESVGRRYDATQETFHETQGREDDEDSAG
jgi:hypothetical protein